MRILPEGPMLEFGGQGYKLTVQNTNDDNQGPERTSGDSTHVLQGNSVAIN